MAKANSWQPYADAMCKDTANVKAAFIVGLDGGVWATKNINISVEEGKNIAAGMKDKSKYQGGGICAGGTKFMYLTADDAAKTAVGRKGANSIMLAQSTKAICGVITNDGANPGNVTSHTFIQQDLIKKSF